MRAARRKAPRGRIDNRGLPVYPASAPGWQG